jgi:hypothetical protein
MAVNRCAISVGAREPLLEWARQHCTAEQIAAVAEEVTLYLIPTYDTDEEAMELLQEGYAGIFEAELEFWCSDEATWPQERTLEQLLDWFEIRFFPLIVDLCSDDLESGQVDEEFVEEVRVVLQQDQDLSAD